MIATEPPSGSGHAWGREIATADRDDIEARPTRPIRGPATGVAVLTPDACGPAVPGYEILGPIGTGGMGVVLKARHLGLDRIVALKMLGQNMAADADSRERFRWEAEAVARLQHPNIIQVFDVGTYDARPFGLAAQPYISFEFVDGGSLARHTLNPQPPAWAARTVETLARAVHAAHDVGVIHRDLKPGNVLLTAAGQPKIADFGLAKHFDADRDARGRFVTQAGLLIGTPEYMAPEQVDGSAASTAIDVYALGVMLYELLTSRVPFKAATVAETCLLVKLQDPVPPRRLQPKLPRDLETVCLKCLAKAPGHRYATAADLADDLARWAAGRTIRARPAGRLLRAGRWAKRNPTVAALSGLVVAVVVAGVSTVLWKWQAARDSAAEAHVKADEAGAANRAERWERYRANVGAASAALQINNGNTARRMLRDAPDEHRGWEWSLLDRQLNGPHRVLYRFDQPVSGVRFLPDGSAALVRTDDAQTWALDLGTGRPAGPPLARDFPAGWVHATDRRWLVARTADGQLAARDLAAGGPWPDPVPGPDPVMVAAYNPTAGRAVTATADGTARVWDLRTRLPAAAFRGHPGGVVQIDLSPDGRRVASVGLADNRVVLWDADTGTVVRELSGPGPSMNGLHFSPDGARLLTVEQYPGPAVRLWDGRTGEPVADLRGHTNQVTAYQFSPDGRRIVTSSRDQSVRLWDGLTGRPVSVSKAHAGWVNAVAFGPDSRVVASGAQDQSVRLWAAEDGAELAVLRGHTGEVLDLGFTPDGAGLTSVGADRTLRLWYARAAGRNGILRGHTNFVYGVAWHPDGRRVASASWDGAVRVWDTRTGETVLEVRHAEGAIVSAVAFHPGGRWLASVGRDDRARLWDLGTGANVRSFPIRSRDWRDTRLAFSPDGSLLACGGPDGVVRLFDVQAGTEVAALAGHTDGVRDVAFSPDGRWLASAGEAADKSVRIWDVTARTAVAVLTGHEHRVYALAFSPDGRTLASGGSDAAVRLWDTGTWDCAATLRVGTNVYGLAFTPDGTRLAVGCGDSSIRVWDAKSRQEVMDLRGHIDYVHQLAFSPDGRRCASCSGDFTVRIWDAGDGR